MEPGLKTGLRKLRNRRKFYKLEGEVVKVVDSGYRQPTILTTIQFTGRFLNNIQVSDHPRRFRSANVTLPLELNSVSIVQNGYQVSLDEENSNFNIYPNKSFQQMVDDGDISIKWFVDSVEVVGETDASLALDENNADQGKNVYAEVTNNIDSFVVTSNTITVVETAWTPQQLTSLTLWLDANDESTITKDSNNRVSQWNDKSPNNKLYTTASGYEPVYDDSLKAIDFGNEQYYLQSSALSSSVLQPYVIINVSKFRSISSDWKNIYDGMSEDSRVLFTNKTNKWFQFDNYGDTGTNTWQTNRDNSTLIPNTNKHIFTSVVDGTNSWISLDGNTEIAQSNTGTGSVFKGLTLATYYGDLSTTRMDGYSQEFVVAQTNDVTEIYKIQGYLAHKWNLTDKLPTNHPYKTTAP